MKRKILITLGALLAVASVSAGSIVLYEYFRPSAGYWKDSPFAERDARRGASRGADMREGLRSGALLPLARALEIAATHLPGEVLKVELEDKHRRSVYEIKVLADNGRVREIELDARSGEVLEIEDD